MYLFARGALLRVQQSDRRLRMLGAASLRFQEPLQSASDCSRTRCNAIQPQENVYFPIFTKMPQGPPCPPINKVPGTGTATSL